jgi:4-aminobutyrate aminotransferase-like enzyme
LIGDVRGDGFMLGVELVKDRKTKKDATVEAQFIIDEMKDNFVLVSTDGRGLNVIKVRPSMQFTKDNADSLLF